MTSLEDAERRRAEAKVRYLRDYLKVGGRKANLSAFAMADAAEYLPPDQRLAVGIAFGKSERELGLALRVAKRDGLAHRAARDLKDDAERHGSWADVRIVEELSIPSRSEVGPTKRISADSAFPVGGDPLMPGVSVGHPRSPAGSLGGFVKFRDGGEGIVSSCHIIANSGRGVDLSSADAAPFVYHPASADVAGRLAPRHQIGRLANFLTLDTASVELDVAAARLLPHRTHIGNVIPVIPNAKNTGKRIVAPPPRNDIARFKTVAKVGRTTGYTEGRLSAGFFDDLGLEVPGIGIVYYSRLFEVESPDVKSPFASPGDSGAAVFDAATRSAFGLVIGGGVWDDDGVSRMLVYSCDLAAALDEMAADWL